MSLQEVEAPASVRARAKKSNGAVPHGHRESKRRKMEDYIANPPSHPIALTIDPLMATEMLPYNTKNRPLKKAWVEELARRINSGQWMRSTDMIAFSSQGRLINGQNRLHAIVRAGKAADAWVWFGAPDNLFEILDQQKTRGVGDILSIDGVPYYNFVAAAMQFVIQYESERKRVASGVKNMSPLEIASEFHYRHKKMLDHVEITTTSKRYGRPSLMLALKYLCAKQSPELAERFFAQVCTGIGLTSKSSGAYRAHQLLEDERGKSGDERMRSWTMMALLIKCWNAERKELRMQSLRFGSEEQFPRII